ncbi:MAG: inositol monophosphatase family protein, partial [Pseudomonadota bacterium]
AEEAAKRAGSALAARGANFSGVEASVGRDIKLKADKAAEALIIETLSAGSDYPILSEETGWTAAEEDVCWVVDPLDGSANYNRKIPFCCTSIALVKAGRPVVGVIYDFNHGDLYSGEVGTGASLNGAPMAVSKQPEKAQSILFTGLPLNGDFSPEALGAMAAGFADWKKVRMMGTAATSLAMVSCGKAERYHEHGIMIWDVAAGCALIEAAGGRVVISEGPLDQPKTVTADNGHLPI